MARSFCPSPADGILVTALLVALLLAGCGDPPAPTYIEVYADPVEEDGTREKSGTCSTSAEYGSHVQLKRGTVTITVTDPEGKREVFEYGEARADERVIEGAPGTWTLHVEWRGFDGSIHAGLLC